MDSKPDCFADMFRSSSVDPRLALYVNTHLSVCCRKIWAPTQMLHNDVRHHFRNKRWKVRLLGVVQNPHFCLLVSDLPEVDSTHLLLSAASVKLNMGIFDSSSFDFLPDTVVARLMGPTVVTRQTRAWV